MSCCGPKPKPGECKFSADYRMKPLANKFWSKHDNGTQGIDISRIKYYEEEVRKTFEYDARVHSKMPRYTSQIHGWLPGYKIRFLQYCNLNISQNPANQKISKELVMQHFKDEKPLTDHCACKTFLNIQDHWKIV